MLNISKPDSTEFSEFFQGYIDLVGPEPLLLQFEQQIDWMHDLFGTLTNEQASLIHPPYRWTLKQVLGHIIDVERVFGYRMARFATGDQVSLAGFNENQYVSQMSYDRVLITSLLDEWINIRLANLAFLRRIDQEQWLRVGISSDRPLSVRAIAFILLGHVIHHGKVVAGRLGREWTDSGPH
jgi:hypothetical protein